VFQVVVLPPPDLAAAIEEFRRLHDPAFHRLGAHLPVLPPFDSGDASLDARFDAAAAGRAFDVELGPPAAAGQALVLPVVGGRGEFLALRAAFATALLPALTELPDAAPSLRVGLFGGAAEMELARRSLSVLGPVAAWRVTEVTLLVEDVRGLWHPLRGRPLAPI
jgi:2'-5' RNA ligase superfamily protein